MGTLQLHTPGAMTKARMKQPFGGQQIRKEELRVRVGMGARPVLDNRSGVGKIIIPSQG